MSSRLDMKSYLWGYSPSTASNASSSSSPYRPATPQQPHLPQQHSSPRQRWTTKANTPERNTERQYRFSRRPRSRRGRSSRHLCRVAAAATAPKDIRPSSLPPCLPHLVSPPACWPRPLQAARRTATAGNMPLQFVLPRAMRCRLPWPPHRKVR